MDMEDVEKMVALKKAFADVILNTSKEAAARVMASERKALRFEQQLRSTNEDALRMLLRLKHMIDAKTKEAEITFVSQRIRIEELEAQLGEAEEVILDLRSELKQVRNQLDYVKGKHMQPSTGLFERDMPSSEKTVHENLLHNSGSFIVSSDSVFKLANSGKDNLPLQLRGFDSMCSNSPKQTEIPITENDNTGVENPNNINSIISKNMEPELCRNGCTQRIRAIERNVYDEKLTPCSVDNQHGKNESLINGSEINMQTCILSSFKHESKDSGKNEEDRSVKFCKLRRRKTRSGRGKASSCRMHRAQPRKPCQPSLAYSHRRRASYTSNGNVEFVERIETQRSPGDAMTNMVENCSGREDRCQDYKDQALSIVRRSLRKRKVKCLDDYDTSYKRPYQITSPYQPHSFFSRCKVFITKNLNSVAKSVDVGVCPEEVGKSGLTKNVIDDGVKVKDKHVLVKIDNDVTDSPATLTCKLKPEMVYVPSMDPYPTDEKLSDICRADMRRAVNDRPLKYTFSRKRRKEENLNKPGENSSFVQNSIEMRTGEKQNGNMESQNCGLMSESSKDSNRLVKVARQLISLSGKSW